MSEVPSKKLARPGGPETPLVEPNGACLKLIREALTTSLNPRPELIKIPQNTDQKLNGLVARFNGVLEKPADQLTENDGWDTVSGFLTFLTFTWEKSPENLDLTEELHHKIQAFFGSDEYLRSSGMNAVRDYRDGFLHVLESLEHKVRQATTHLDTSSHPIPASFF